MITNKIEVFTAQEAINAGLPEALERGETKVEGNYAIFGNGGLEFKQRNFVFRDKEGNLRVGKFKDEGEIFSFMTELSTKIKEEEEDV